MNYLGNELVYLETDRVNYWPDRRDRAAQYLKLPNRKVCRPDRFVPRRGGSFEGRNHI
ncbi:MAG: hypothetical protein LKJ17_04075 [Oscillospiraceae bacterium]|jgi:hypothetical protein|nr:hypothetical protein [Oscillospiraceae bacterium]